jgi:hypothetical protein
MELSARTLFLFESSQMILGGFGAQSSPQRLMRSHVIIERDE